MYAYLSELGKYKCVCVCVSVYKQKPALHELSIDYATLTTFHVGMGMGQPPFPGPCPGPTQSNNPVASPSQVLCQLCPKSK